MRWNNPLYITQQSKSLLDKSEWNCETHFNFLRWCSSHAIAVFYLHSYGMREYLEHLIEYSWGREKHQEIKICKHFLCDIKIKIARNRQPSAKNSSLPLFEIFLNYFFSQTRGDPTTHLFFANLRGEDCQIIRMFIYLESHKCKASCDVSLRK